jgi:hypothetical protein
MKDATSSGHSIRVLLAGEHIDGFVQPNGGWRTIWVEPGQDNWTAIRQQIGDIRRVARCENMLNKHTIAT